MQKKVLAINDISCVGRCSLTVALPIISAAGIECSVLPTSILSTHTGGFTNYTFFDFTSQMTPIANHWKSLNLNFDAIYTGFLGSKEQIDVVCNICKDFKNENNLLIVDPAMADNGKMYPIFDLEFANEMRKLCSQADIIIPNITEACFLTGVPYEQAPHSEEFINKLIDKLGELEIKSLILTGVSYDSDFVGAISYNYETSHKEYYKRNVIPEYFHGTGDCFASAFVAAITKKLSLEKSSRIAVDFTVDSILETIKYPNIDKKYGVCFEEALPKLIGEIHG